VYLWAAKLVDAASHSRSASIRAIASAKSYTVNGLEIDMARFTLTSPGFRRAASRRRCSAAACSRVALARRLANNGLVVLFDGHDAFLLVFELIVEWKERDVLAGQGRQFLLERLGVEVRIDEMYVFAVPRLG